jgi:hypothetical protein
MASIVIAMINRFCNKLSRRRTKLSVLAKAFMDWAKTPTTQRVTETTIR